MVNPRDTAGERKEKNIYIATQVRVEYMINTGNKYKHWKKNRGLRTRMVYLDKTNA